MALGTTALGRIALVPCSIPKSCPNLKPLLGLSYILNCGHACRVRGASICRRRLLSRRLQQGSLLSETTVLILTSTCFQKYPGTPDGRTPKLPFPNPVPGIDQAAFSVEDSVVVPKHIPAGQMLLHLNNAECNSTLLSPSMPL